jgi:hypothetical protein
MRRLGLAITVVASLAATGCASGPSYHLQGRSLAEFQQADQHCANDITNEDNMAAAGQAGSLAGQAAVSGNGAVTAAALALVAFQASNWNDRHAQCMAAKGFARAR